MVPERKLRETLEGVMRKLLAGAISISFVGLFFAACSGDNANSDASADGTVDAIIDNKKPLPETSTNDVATGTCSPSATIDTSQITWVPPITPEPSGCSSVQVSDYYNDCLGTSATSTTCQGFTNNAANATCNTCLISTYDKDTKYGALIQIGGVDYANIAGCIAILTGDVSSTGCGAKNQAVTDCETLACSSSCPAVTDQTSFTEYTDCTTAADSAVCASYVTAECDLQDAGTDGSAAAYATCENQASFEDYYNTMAVVFCGGYAVSDAGTDAGDASTDAAIDAPDGD
jgi:hypothetical protein